jgi:hypothetical protein
MNVDYKNAEQFESIARSEGFHDLDVMGNGCYADDFLQHFYLGWQASRQALSSCSEIPNSSDHASRQGVEGDGGQHIDDIAVDRFAEAMKKKLAKQRQKGYGGWNDKEMCPDGRLQKYLGAHLGKGDPVDIGNFAMMIWNRGESVTDAGVPDADYIRALQDAFDIIQADANTEENYGSMCRIGSVLDKLKDEQEQSHD